MKLGELAAELGATVLTREADLSRRVERVFAGDRMSDVLNQASSGTLVVTNLASPQLVRAAALMDACGVCLLNGVSPSDRVVETAAAGGIALLVSLFDMFETCGRLYQSLCCPSQATMK